MTGSLSVFTRQTIVADDFADGSTGSSTVEVLL